MAGIENSVGTWSHLRQTCLVRQETLYADGHVEFEDRYFVTSLPLHSFSPQHILLAVRNHFRVENDANNSQDVQWREDSGPWCTQGTAVWTLGILRLMAYKHGADPSSPTPAQKKHPWTVVSADELALLVQDHRQGVDL